MKQPIFRFAPSPNGYLHLGHALSALIDFEMARTLDGRFLLPGVQPPDVVERIVARLRERPAPAGRS